MKTYLLPLKNISLLICIAALSMLSACAKKIYFNESAVVPKANGKVTWKSSGNNAYEVEVNTYYLSKPGMLTPPKGDYMVWIEGADGSIHNAGKILTMNSLTSPVLEGEIVVTTGVRPVRVFITAEDSTSAPSPGATVVLTTPRF